ncbi:hypothetical protein UFOVP68_31 [uncultured Caudovirales phage]|uniref:Uncharacterized protein n=1 Tax=uncultured Caudovirales phage TaxID=2100421 RepID=A0A6J5L2E2_9CAUD|nr:hypothetical protein UFOVP68_31 [uncultured Caudovirales phage]
MAKYTLNIETEDAHELRGIVSRIAGEAEQVAAIVTEAFTAETAAPAPVADKPKVAPKAKKADAAPLSSSPAPDASKSDTGAATESATTADTATASGAKTSLTPPPAAPTVTYEQVKEALIALMDKKSASAVQALLKDKFGVIAISQLPKDKLGEAFEALNVWVAEA